MRMKDKLFSLFFCIYLFWFPLACVILAQKGMSMDGSIMRMLLVSIFVLSFIFYLNYKFARQELKVWSVLLVFGLLFYITRFFYSTVDEGYHGQFLRWGADCVSACLIGMTLMKLKDYSLIHKFFPWICIILTVFLVYSTFENAREMGQMHLEGGLNYQIVAYNLAVLFCLSFYYAFINKESSFKIVRILMVCCLPLQAVACCMSGGRGGVVLLVVYLLVMAYIMLHFHIITISKLVFIGILGMCLFMYAANYFHLWEAAGFMRSSGLLKDDDRFLLWKGIWHYVEDNYGIGYGLGGDYYTFGFYTHNILLDFVLETGFLGTIILTYIFVKIYKAIFNQCMNNNIFIILVIISLYGLVMNMFSGYWITTYSHWMALGIAMTCRKYFGRIY